MIYRSSETWTLPEAILNEEWTMSAFLSVVGGLFMKFWYFFDDDIGCY